MSVWHASIEIMLGIVLLSLCACASTTGARGAPRDQPADASAVAPPVSWTLELTGAGLEHPRVFTYGQLDGMNMARLDDITQQKTHFPDERTSWRGPLLEDLLSQAGLRPGPMNFTLQGSDGYTKTCTREELNGAIVALQDGEGRRLVDVGRQVVTLIPPRLTGDYWIRNLQRIDVEPVGAAGEPG